MSTTSGILLGYAYYSVGSDGFVYATTNGSSDTPGTAVVVVNGVSKATNLFSLLFLAASGALCLVLLIILAVTLYCRRRVTKMEEAYWRLQHEHAEVNDELLREVVRRTPAAQPQRKPSMRRTTSSNSVRSAAAAAAPPQPQRQQPQRQPSMQRAPSMQRRPSVVYEQPPLQQQQQRQLAMQRYNSVSNLPTPPQSYPTQMTTIAAAQPTANPWAPASPHAVVYPPPSQRSLQPFTFPIDPAACPDFDYNSIYTTNPPVQQPILAPSQQQRQQEPPASASSLSRAPSASPDVLRRRGSKVRFVGA